MAENELLLNATAAVTSAAAANTAFSTALNLSLSQRPILMHVKINNNLPYMECPPRCNQVLLLCLSQ